MQLKSIFNLFKKSKYEPVDNSDSKENKKSVIESTITNVLLEAGLSKALSKEYQGALQDFNKVIEIDPFSEDAANAYLERVKIKLELNDLATVQDDMAASQEILDRLDQAWDAYDKGGEDYDSGDYKSAIKNYNNAISLRPSLKDVYYNRGIAKQVLKDFKEAIEDFDKAIEINASNIIDAYTQRAKIKHQVLKDKAGALEDFNKAIELSPKDDNLYFSRAIVLDDYDAIQDLNKAIELNPSTAKYYWARGLRRHKNKDFEGGQKDILKYIELTPTDEDITKAEAYSIMGSMRIGIKDYRGSLQELNKAIELDPFHVEAYSDRGFAKYFLKEYEGAIKDFDKAIELKPTEGDAYYYRGECKILLGFKDEGRLDIDKAEELGYSVTNDDYNEEEAKAYAEEHFKKIVAEVKEEKALQEAKLKEEPIEKVPSEENKKKWKEMADNFRKLKDKPLLFKDKDGNIIDISK